MTLILNVLKAIELSDVATLFTCNMFREQLIFLAHRKRTLLMQLVQKLNVPSALAIQRYFRKTKFRIILLNEIENEDHEESGKLRILQVNNHNSLLDINMVLSVVVSKPVFCSCTNIRSEK